MHNILIAGAGIIGKTVAHWLNASLEYQVHIADIHPPSTSLAEGIRFSRFNVTNQTKLQAYLKQHQITAVIGTLPHSQLAMLSELITSLNVHYFDVTEDTGIAAMLTDLKHCSTRAIVPQCGLAPGYINIIAHDLMQQFDTIESVKLRCGAIPQNTSNSLHYAFTWSIDGLVNEYINPCQTLHNKALTNVPAPSDIETIEIDGQCYEAFHTSGGLAGLARHFEGRIPRMDYKTIRYPGHAEKMRFLLKDLKLEQHRDELITILTRAIPYTHDDIVVIYVAVNGNIDGQLTQKTFVRKYYPQTVFGKSCSALELTTTAGLCSMVDLVLQHPEAYSGLVQHQQFTLNTIFNNRFGKPLAPTSSRSHYEPITTA